MNPVKEISITAVVCSFYSLENSLNDLLFLWNGREETVSVAHDSVELSAGQATFSSLLLSVETLEGDLSSMTKNEGCEF